MSNLSILSKVVLTTQHLLQLVKFAANSNTWTNTKNKHYKDFVANILKLAKADPQILAEAAVGNLYRLAILNPKKLVIPNEDICELASWEFTEYTIDYLLT